MRYVSCVLFVLYCALCARAAPQTVWVDARWDGPGRCGGHVWKGDAFSRIQDAVTAVAQHGTVRVAPGRYLERLTIPRPMTLLGPGADTNPNAPAPATPFAPNPARVDIGKEAIIIPPVTERETRNALVMVQSSQVTIVGFTLDGDNPALDDGSKLHDIDANMTVGIGCQNYPDHLILARNILRNFTYAGIRIEGAQLDNSVVIAYNRIDNIPLNPSIPHPEEYPVELCAGIIAGVGGYEIFGNTITRTAVGVCVHWVRDGTRIFTPVISENAVQSEVTGINFNMINDARMQGSVSVTAPRMLVANNRIHVTPRDAQLMHAGVGICSLEHNSKIIISENDISGGDAGVFIWNAPSLDAGNVVIDGGIFHDLPYGIWLSNYQALLAYPVDTTGVVVSRAVFAHPGVAGIYLGDDTFGESEVEAVVMHGTQFLGGQYGVLVRGGRATLVFDGKDAAACGGQTGGAVELQPNERRLSHPVEQGNIRRLNDLPTELPRITWTGKPADLQQVMQANYLLGQRQYHEAITALQALIAADPQGPASIRRRLYLGMCYAEMGQFDHAIATFEEVAKEETTIYGGEALLQLFLTHARRGEKAKSEAVRQRLYTAWPRSEYVQRVLESDFRGVPADPMLSGIGTAYDAHGVVPGAVAVDPALACRRLEDAARRDILPDQGIPVLYNYYTSALLDKAKAAKTLEGTTGLGILDRLTEWQHRYLAYLERHQCMTRYAMSVIGGNLACAQQIVQLLPDTDPTRQDVVVKARELYALTYTSYEIPLAWNGIEIMRPIMLADRQPDAWAPIYAGLIARIPLDEKKRAAYLLQYGQDLVSMSKSASSKQAAVELAKSAREAFGQLIAEYRNDAVVKDALTGMVTLFAAEKREDDVQALLNAVAKSRSQPMREWLVEYTYQLGTPEGYARSLKLLNEVVTQYPAHPMRPVWLYRIGRCQEQLGHRAEAMLAYNELIDGYPGSEAAGEARLAVQRLEKEH